MKKKGYYMKKEEPNQLDLVNINLLHDDVVSLSYRQEKD